MRPAKAATGAESALKYGTEAETSGLDAALLQAQQSAEAAAAENAHLRAENARLKTEWEQAIKQSQAALSEFESDSSGAAVLQDRVAGLEAELKETCSQILTHRAEHQLELQRQAF